MGPELPLLMQRVTFEIRQQILFAANDELTIRRDSFNIFYQRCSSHIKRRMHLCATMAYENSEALSKIKSKRMPVFF
jgi:hypothetical protein